MNSPVKIPIGFATVVGQLASIVQFVGATVVLVVGTKTHQSQAVSVLFAGGGLTQLGVIAGRYLQAHKQIAQVVSHVEADASALLPSLATELAAPPPPGV